MPTIEQKPYAEPKPQQGESAISVINLINSSGFDSEAQTVIVGRNITAAIETAHGILVQRQEGRGLDIVTERYLLPWANIKSVKYARVVPPKA